MCVTGKRLKCTLTSGSEDSIEQVSGSRLVLDEGTKIPSLIRGMFAFLAGGGVCVVLECCTTCRASSGIYVGASMARWRPAGQDVNQLLLPTVFRHGQHCVLAGR